MDTKRQTSDRILSLEAPGDFLSGLLGVSAACELSLKAGSLRNLPEEFGLWRLIAPMSGRLQIAFGERSWPLEPQQAAAADGREDLSLLPAEDCRVCLIALRGAAADAVFADCRVNGGLFFERGGIAAERMLHLLSAGSDRQVPAKEASEYAYQLLMALSGSGSPGPAGRRKLPPVVEAALGILRRDYAFLEGIGELAERLEVSQEYLTRCFVKYMGVTPGKYLNQVRIENAMLLLRQGRHSVQFVSDACGFSNGNYFARVFRSAVGMNPREYARLQHALPPEAQDREDSLYVL